MTIQLVTVTPENHQALRALDVTQDQIRFVASVEKSLADAYVYKDAIFRGALENGVACGYVLVFPFFQDEQRIVNIVRLMIDSRFQGRGLGRALLNATIEWIDTFTPSVDLIRISTLPDNIAALSLYESFGFMRQGIEEGEIALYLPSGSGPLR